MVPVSQSIEMNEVPQVFRATYSSTDVFECIVNEFPIMRRCKDGWVNATQILKCCNFPKAKRTKILEKGVQLGLHEKIQGGFGKFQGTWIPLPDAQKLATEYGLTGTMAPVLFLDLSDPGLKIPLKVKPPPKEPTPVKRKYTKKAKKVDETPTKKYKGESFETPGSLNQPFMQFSQNQQVQLQQLPPSFQQPEFRQIGQNSQQMPQNIQGQAVQPHSQFSSHNQTAQQEFQNYQVAQMQRIQQQQLQQQQQLHQQQQLQQNLLQQLHGIPQQVLLQQQAQIQQIQQLQQVQQVQQQFQRTSQIHPNQHSITANVSVDQLGQKQAGKFYSPQFPVQQLGFQDPLPAGISAQSKPLSQSTNENWSQDEINHSQMGKDSDTSISSNEEHNNNLQLFHLQDKQSFADESMMSPPSQSANTTRSSIPEKETYAQQLLRFFSDDHAQIPYFVNNLPFDFDINDPIDDEGHTPLHWAASIGNYQMIHLLLIKGSNPLVVNNFGLNPLSKLISFNNCYELKNFPKVLDDLELCLINTDINGRTPLHYLCQFAKIKSKYESLRYYLQIILNKLSTLSQSNNSDKPQVDLLKNVLDHQDINGDTCLHLAIKSGSTKIMNALLKYGARDDLENINEQTARQLIMHYNLETYEDKHPEQYAEHITQNEHSRHHAPTSEASEVPQIGQLGPSQMNPPNSSQVSEAALYQEPYQVLATPVQPYGNGSVDTPDTQRTTIQTDDIEEDDSAANGSSFVKSELSKANIFMEEKEYEKNYASKEYDEKDYNKVSDFNSLSTPVKNRSNLIVPHLALAVISERTVESTPVQAREAVISHKPRPPILGEDGKIKELDADPECDEAKLLMNDLSSMVSGMINSLSDSYREQLAELNNESKRLNAEIVGKKHLNEALLEGFQKSLDGHIELSQMSSVTEGEDLLSKVIDEQQAAIDLQEVKLLNSLTLENALKLYEAVEEEEYATTGETGAIETDNGDDLEEQFMCAMELTQLQMQKSDLLIRLTLGVKNFGIDNKMYKYRKLISLSCGLKVEDIDSLIDGIEESLMQAS